MTAILAAMLTAGCGTAGNIVSVETSTTENSITKTNNTEESITGASNTEESITGASNTEENTTVESSTQEAQDAYLAFPFTRRIPWKIRWKATMRITP